MFKLRSKGKQSDLVDSALYNQDTFYKEFLRNISRCKTELLIESPFITSRRMQLLMPIFRKLRKRGVKIIVNTRCPDEHYGVHREQAVEAIADMRSLGVKVLYTVRHHRKMSIIDRTIIWEGSLNILSYSNSCEIMRRIVSPGLAQQTIRFIGVKRYL